MRAVEVRQEVARRAAAQVPDPELPFLTLADLGILRDVTIEDGRIVVTVTPTYSGCPAMREIGADLRRRLAETGVGDAEVRTALTPPWTSDWITDDGRRKLAAAGIAPPHAAPVRRAGPIPLTLGQPVRVVTCPHCGSDRTRQQSAFGATACKALYRCDGCAEPFDYVKEI